jgi:hypothetical protein
MSSRHTTIMDTLVSCPELSLELGHLVVHKPLQRQRRRGPMPTDAYGLSKGLGRGKVSPDGRAKAGPG